LLKGVKNIAFTYELIVNIYYDVCTYKFSNIFFTKIHDPPDEEKVVFQYVSTIA